LITDEVLGALPELPGLSVGLLHLFMQHTSASITINENADPDVRADMEQHFLRAAPDNASFYQHVLEGPDDMPAHIKSVIVGCERMLPVKDGRLALGIWQGIYLGEHRARGGQRTLLATLQGQEQGAIHA